MNDAPHRVLVADDDSLTRTLVAATLRSAGLEPVGPCASVTAAMTLAQKFRPVAAVIDLDFGRGPTGIDLAHGLRALNTRIGIVLLTSYDSPILAGIERVPPPGVRYVLKRSVSDTEVLTIAVHSAIAEPLVSPDRASAGTGLTDSQLDTLRMVAAGLTNAEIARRQSVAEASVTMAVNRIIKRLDIKAGPDQNQRVLLALAYRNLVGLSGAIRA